MLNNEVIITKFDPNVIKKSFRIFWLTRVIIDLFKKEIFMTPVVVKQLETIIEWSNFTIFFFSCIWHHMFCMTFSRQGGDDPRRKCKIFINHWKWPAIIDQQPNFDGSLAYVECFCFYLNVSSGFEILIRLSYPSWWNLPSVVDRETATPEPFQVSEISQPLTNRLEINISFRWRLSLAISWVGNRNW